MCDLSKAAAVKTQYATADRLNTRISIHSKYSTNKQGFGSWIFSHYQIEAGMRVLDAKLPSLIQTNERVSALKVA
ncbi:MAG: hypothetical protein IK099_02555 [Clostridia bacterium]|nr:hypothetical protein [Clostridia bacterium]